MAVITLALAVVLLPVAVWVTVRLVRRAMKPRGDEHALVSDRALMRRDLLGLALTAAAFTYWHGFSLDPLALLERAANAVIITALVALVATVLATVLLVALADARRLDTLRRCGVVFLASLRSSGSSPRACSSATPRSRSATPPGGRSPRSSPARSG